MKIKVAIIGGQNGIDLVPKLNTNPHYEVTHINCFKEGHVFDDSLRAYDIVLLHIQASTALVVTLWQRKILTLADYPLAAIIEDTSVGVHLTSGEIIKASGRQLQTITCNCITQAGIQTILKFLATHSLQNRLGLESSSSSSGGIDDGAAKNVECRNYLKTMLDKLNDEVLPHKRALHSQAMEEKRTGIFFSKDATTLATEIAGLEALQRKLIDINLGTIDHTCLAELITSTVDEVFAAHPEAIIKHGAPGFINMFRPASMIQAFCDELKLGTRSLDKSSVAPGWW